MRFLDQPVNHSLVRALRRVPDFSTLEDHILLRVVGASANLFWPQGSFIFEKGSPSEALYIVLSGEIRIFDQDEERTDIARIGPGDYFGELSLLSRATHSKGAEALEDAELLVLPKASFEALLASDDELADQIRRTGKARMETALT